MASVGRVLQSWIITTIVLVVIAIVYLVAKPQIMNWSSVLLTNLPQFADWSQFVSVTFDGVLIMCGGASILWAILSSISTESDSWLDESPFGRI